MKIHVINIPHRGDRRARFLKWNGDHKDLDYEFRAGVVLDPKSPNLPEGFTVGAAGCAAAHATLWTECAQGKDPYIIMEDDACISKSFIYRAWDVLNYNLGWDIFYFGYNRDGWLGVDGYHITGVPAADPALECSAFCHEYCPSLALRANLVWGTLAYAATPAGAANLLKHCYPLDRNKMVRTPNGVIPVIGVDGMINAALQRDELGAVAYFPPLVIGPNDKSDSDVLGKEEQRATQKFLVR